MASQLNRALNQTIKRQLSRDRDLIVQTKKIIEKSFVNIRREMLSEFENHPVTKELSAGSMSSNVTNTLVEGNLFGFIGFDGGDNPIQEIESLLRKTEIIVKRRQMGNHGFIWTYLVTSPSLKQLYSATPMPWARGSSWLREIEGRGIPNIGQYMHKKIKSSRSGVGFQNKNKSQGGKLKIPYIKQILINFEKELNSIEASRVSRANF